MIMCCHPSLSPASAIPLALRAVGGLTTREIAVAFLSGETRQRKLGIGYAALSGASPLQRPPRWFDSLLT